MSDVDRKYSNGSDWDNSIDYDDEPDGSEGGYDRHGNFIIANAMVELVKLRVENTKLREALEEMVRTQDEWETAVGKIAQSEPKVFTRAIDRARAVLAETKGGGDE
jgi:hypothetical protein